MNVKARAKILIIVFCILLLLSLGAITYAARTTKEVVYIDPINSGFMSKEEFMQNYAGFYANLNYEKIEEYPFSFIMQPKYDSKYVNAYEVNNTQIDIFLGVCRREHGGCAFRINGIATNWFKPSTDKTDYLFSLGNGYALKINKISFDYCGQRFCDPQRELYDIVNITIFKE